MTRYLILFLISIGNPPMVSEKIIYSLDFTNRLQSVIASCCVNNIFQLIYTVMNDFYLIRTCEQIAEQGRAPSTNKRMEGGDSEYSEQVQHRFGRLIDFLQYALGIWKLSILQGCHIAPKPELFTKQAFQCVFPMPNLSNNLRSVSVIGYHGYLKFSHMF